MKDTTERQAIQLNNTKETGLPPSQQEVGRRWLTITRIAKCMFEGLPQVKEQRIEALARDKKKIQKLRSRLSSISWFMAILCENIARRANQEDECRGRFFETRFKCRECVDPNGMLLCALYVETNRTTLRPTDHRLRGKESCMIVDLKRTHNGVHDQDIDRTHQRDLALQNRRICPANHLLFVTV